MNSSGGKACLPSEKKQQQPNISGTCGRLVLNTNDNEKERGQIEQNRARKTLSHQVKLIITNRPPHPKSQFVPPDELARFKVAEMQLDVIVGHLNEKIPGCILGRSSDSSSPTISNVRISSLLDGGKRRRWTAAAANQRMPALGGEWSMNTFTPWNVEWKFHAVKWRVKFHAVKLGVKNNILGVKYYWSDCSEISHAMIII